jgi:hypothetical protein
MKPEDILTEVLESGSNLPNIRELISKVHAQLGGTDKVAELIAEAIKSAPDGSAQQARMLGDYMGVIAKVGGNEDLELATEEMLQRTGAKLLKELSNDNRN